MAARFRLVLFFILSVTASACPLSAEETRSEPASSITKGLGEKWLRFAELDRRFNTEFWADQVESKSVEEAAIPFDVWFLDKAPRGVDLLPIMASCFQGHPFLRQFNLGEDHENVIHPIFLPRIDHPVLNSFRRKFGRSKFQMMGVKLRSHNSYLVWDPQRNFFIQPFVLKYSQEFSDFTASHSFYSGSLTTEALAFRLVLSRIRQSEANPALAEWNDDFLPEPLTMSISASFGALSYTVRFLSSTSHIAGLVTIDSSSLDFLPLHAFLGSELLNDYAHQSGLGRERWLSEHFVPRFAEFLAKLNHGYGFYPAAHSQNVLVEIDRETGLIHRFVFRDLADVIQDSSVHYLRNPEGESARHSVTIGGVVVAPYEMWGRSRDALLSQATQPGANMAEYAAQSFSYFVSDLKKQREYASIFLSHYLHETENVLAQKILLSSKASFALARLSDPSISVKHFSSTFDEIEIVVDDIWQSVLETRLRARPFQNLRGDLVGMYNLKTEIASRGGILPLSKAGVQLNRDDEMAMPLSWGDHLIFVDPDTHSPIALVPGFAKHYREGQRKVSIPSAPTKLSGDWRKNIIPGVVRKEVADVAEQSANVILSDFAYKLKFGFKDLALSVYQDDKVYFVHPRTGVVFGFMAKVPSRLRKKILKSFAMQHSCQEWVASFTSAVREILPKISSE